MSISEVSKTWVVAAGAGLVLILGVFDTLTGQVISFSVFYMLPICLVTWYVGRWSGISISIFSALVWLAADFASAQTATHTIIPIWNMMVRLCSFLLMSYLLSELQKNEVRRRSLERIFFHDILNVVGSVRGYAELLRDKVVPGTQEIYDLLYQSADRSIEDIEAQRVLASAESEDLRIELTLVNTELIVKLVVNLYQHHEVSRNKIILVDDSIERIEFESDLSLMSRVLGNMLKNALESTERGGVVTIGCCQEHDRICFWVHNKAAMPESVQKQIFKQTISTKSNGRGFGSYSMKLLTDYLHGHISFSSNEKEGTLFKACYPVSFPKTNKH